MFTHQGTHLDVPYHFYDDGKTVDQVPLDRFYGSAALVDLAPGNCLAAKTPITLEMLAPQAAKFQAGGQGDLSHGLGPHVRHARVFQRFPHAHAGGRSLDRLRAASACWEWTP